MLTVLTTTQYYSLLTIANTMRGRSGKVNMKIQGYFQDGERTATAILDNFAAVSDRHSLAGLARAGANSLYSFDNVVALLHLTEHYVFAVQPGAQHSCDEELKSVRYIRIT